MLAKIPLCGCDADHRVDLLRRADRASLHPCRGAGLEAERSGKGSPVSAQRVDEEWQLRAACRGPHAEVFYPPTSSERRDEKTGRERRAKEICRTCAVKSPCLEYALRIREHHGIWGGLNEIERRNLLASRT